MSLYEFKCPGCNKEYETNRPMSEVSSVGDKDKGATCPKCKTVGGIRMFSSGIRGWDGNPEPWDYDYVKHAKPKFVKDSKGNRHKYNHNKHDGGRRGQG